jgi:hypothetical protein
MREYYGAIEMMDYIGAFRGVAGEWRRFDPADSRSLMNQFPNTL